VQAFVVKPVRIGENGDMIPSVEPPGAGGDGLTGHVHDKAGIFIASSPSPTLPSAPEIGDAMR